LRKVRANKNSEIIKAVTYFEIKMENTLSQARTFIDGLIGYGGQYQNTPFSCTIGSIRAARGLSPGGLFDNRHFRLRFLPKISSAGYIVSITTVFKGFDIRPG
jgi:hypothetical protein